METDMRHQAKYGFTLIELLVVIAIISLLVSILLPSLQSAKTIAMRTMCQVNQKSISYCLNMYLDEYNQILPHYGWGYWYWTDQLGQYAGEDNFTRDSDNRANLTKVFKCPADEPLYSSGGFWGGYISYAPTYMWAGRPSVATLLAGTAERLSIDDFRDPTAYHAFLEKSDSPEVGADQLWRAGRYYCGFSYTDIAQMWAAINHHGGGINISYLDGHIDFAEFKEFEDIPTYQWGDFWNGNETAP